MPLGCGAEGLGSAPSQAGFWASVISNSLTSLPSCKMGTCLNLAGEWTKPTGCANTTSRGVYGTLCSHTMVGGTVGPPVSAWPGSRRLSVQALRPE